MQSFSDDDFTFEALELRFAQERASSVAQHSSFQQHTKAPSQSSYQDSRPFHSTSSAYSHAEGYIGEYRYSGAFLESENAFGSAHKYSQRQHNEYIPAEYNEHGQSTGIIYNPSSPDQDAYQSLHDNKLSARHASTNHSSLRLVSDNHSAYTHSHLMQLSPQPSQARSTAIRVPIRSERNPTYGRPAEIDEFEGEFPDDPELWNIDDKVLSQQRQCPTDRRSPLIKQNHYQQAVSSRSYETAANQSLDGLVCVSSLPDRYRSWFRFGAFNRVQSRCLQATLHSDENLVICAPTGSGKTVIFELAIIRLLETTGSGKAVYLAPTKALCSEKANDWNKKFAGIGVQCVELTGDTDMSGQAFKGVQNARVIVTTPEKWDSVTRWKNTASARESMIANHISLLLIDEVHILREKRGAVLEVVVSRMKALNSVRVVALSATVPNVEDVGRWLRPMAGTEISDINSGVQSQTAKVFKFDDEYRPCPLKKVIIAYPKKDTTNHFIFAKFLETKVFELLTIHAEGKPILVFCPTRVSTMSCADQLAKQYGEEADRGNKLPWSRLQSPLGVFQNARLQKIAPKGICFHHGGLLLDDRRLVEASYLSGAIKVIVCTSTLAVGINLPAHTVVVLGTKMFSGEGMVDYSDLDMLQMIGRAGRPQFDTSGLALIMTDTSSQLKFEQLSSGKTILESSLHEHLTEHINSEIALSTITSRATAQTWIKGSFLYLRILQNPSHYLRNLGKDIIEQSSSATEALDKFCVSAIDNLEKAGLVTFEEEGNPDSKILITPTGNLMSKHNISFGTMKKIVALPDKVTLRDLLECLCDAQEFDDLKLRNDEKTAYRALAKGEHMRFPTKEMKSTRDKIFVLFQTICGGGSLTEVKIDAPILMQSLSVFRSASRITQTIVQVGVERNSGSIVKFGLELLRAANSKAWENFGSVIFKQIDKLGEKALKILQQNKITSFKELAADPNRIERLMNRKPPFGTQIVNQIRALPTFSLEIEEISVETFKGRQPVQVCLEITVAVTSQAAAKKKGFLPYLSISALVVTSEMILVDFRKSAIKNFKKPQSYVVTMKLSKPSESVSISVTCNEIAGVGAFATYNPDVRMEEYPVPDTRPREESSVQEIDQSIDITTLHTDDDTEVDPGKFNREIIMNITLPTDREDCSHPCKDKTICAHLCCREGKVPRKLSSRCNSASGPKVSTSTESRTSQDYVVKSTAINSGNRTEVWDKVDNVDSAFGFSETEAAGRFLPELSHESGRAPSQQAPLAVTHPVKRKFLDLPIDMSASKPEEAGTDNPGVFNREDSFSSRARNKIARLAYKPSFESSLPSSANILLEEEDSEEIINLTNRHRKPTVVLPRTSAVNRLSNKPLFHPGSSISSELVSSDDISKDLADHDSRDIQFQYHRAAERETSNMPLDIDDGEDDDHEAFGDYHPAFLSGALSDLNNPSRSKDIQSTKPHPNPLLTPVDLLNSNPNSAGPSSALKIQTNTHSEEQGDEFSDVDDDDWLMGIRIVD
ncbi:DNA/RNA helicase MER3/SLH1, DEAD-box superfamily [Phaffia rhodozyma]|uniref:DNA 3'-5' helicase n=1 Tax=Phaffia rhodozyma TaxID=264483 RepID=A0A0F7SY15_PHARH|nr:DNA/RNA helicase MER3/SLH1, DEAD-box superfamily [Phaffia rhodozyma]